jgi:hypothetical protein
MSLTQGEIQKLAKKYADQLRKAAASVKASRHTKARIGKRPIRVDTLLKKHGAESGADLRIPLMGGTKFPTKDSLQYSKKLLNKSMDTSGMGGPSKGIKSLVPNYSSKLDIMPKTGADMTIANDPLIQYLRKEAQRGQMTGAGKGKGMPEGLRRNKNTKPCQAGGPGMGKGMGRGKGEKRASAPLVKSDGENPMSLADGDRTAGKDWPKGAPPKPSNVIECNLNDMPKGEKEQALTPEDPTPMNPAFPAKETVKDWKGYLSKMFENKIDKKKCGQKDYPADVGEVDKVLRS